MNGGLRSENMNDYNQDIVSSIKDKLAEIEKAENVRILLAIESGSRAWGFESKDSDYDVRFIYVRRPEDYIRLYPMRDVIEWQLDEVYDISGWDLQKALRLMHDSNPSVHEWCSSGIVYRSSEEAGRIRELSEELFIPKKALYHYVSMAGKNYNKYLSDDEIKVKKYFYVLRSLLAARWVADKGTVPPIRFDDLAEAGLPEELRPVVEELIRLKRNAEESDKSKRIPELDRYIEGQLEALKEAADAAENRNNEWESSEALFRQIVMGLLD